MGGRAPIGPDEGVPRTLGRLIPAALHELANPLLALTGSAELASREAEPRTKLHAHLATVQRMGDELTEIVRALQAFARLQQEPPARLALADEAERAVALVRRVGIARGVELTVRREAEPEVLAAPGSVGSELVGLLLDRLADPDRSGTLVLVVSRQGDDAVAAVAGAGELRLAAAA